MKKLGFEEAAALIVLDDIRYSRDAYYFLRDALAFTSEQLEKPARGKQRHLSAAELLDGFRDYAIQQFGPMARTVLNHWGICSTEDIGAVVFKLVEKGVLGKTDEDRIGDFSGGYDFDDAFARPFRAGKERMTCPD